MEPHFTPELRRFRREVRDVLDRPQVVEQGAVSAAAPAEEHCAATVHRLLGEHRMLAPDWPQEYGGRAATIAHATIVLEEITACGLPDIAFINTIRNAGSLLLYVASAEQKARYLPPLASGQATMAVLYTEPEAGSDLASLRTRADPVQDGWRLSGSKTYAVQVSQAAHAIVAARTSARGRPEAGITLFLVPLDAAGVRMRQLETLYPDPFYEVVLDGVFVADADVLGPVDGGWFVLSAGLAIERTGVDYNAKAIRWLDLAAERIEADGSDPVLTERLVALRTQAAAGRLLAWRLLDQQEDGMLDAEEAAMSKWYNGELCVLAARLALDVGGLAEKEPTGGLDSGMVAAMLREAPGLTLSAGTSEIMLHVVASGMGLGGPL